MFANFFSWTWFPYFALYGNFLLINDFDFLDIGDGTGGILEIS